MRSNFFQKSCHSASARVGHNLFKKTRKTNNLWHASLTENAFSYHFFKKYYLQKLTPKLLQNIFWNYKDNILSKSLRVKALDMQPVILLKTSVNPITAIFQKNFEWLLQSKKRTSRQLSRIISEAVDKRQSSIVIWYNCLETFEKIISTKSAVECFFTKT